MSEPGYPEPLPAGAPVDRRVAGVVLVDPRGWLLLQLRTDDAPVSPGQWGIVGGGIEGAEDPRQAMHRELAEETGLQVDGAQLAFTGVLAGEYGNSHWHLFLAPTTATDADVVLGEGTAIVFVDPTTLGDLDLATSAGKLLPALVGSAAYQALLT